MSTPISQNLQTILAAIARAVTVTPVKFSEKVQRARGDRSYADVGRAAGCTGENIRKLEAGISEPGFRLGIALAKTLGVPSDWLADDEADWPPPPPVDLDSRIVRTVHDALVADRQRDALTLDEGELLVQLRGRGIRQRGSREADAVFDGIAALLGIWDALRSQAVSGDGGSAEAARASASGDSDAGRRLREAVPPPEQSDEESAARRRVAGA